MSLYISFSKYRFISSFLLQSQPVKALQSVSANRLMKPLKSSLTDFIAFNLPSSFSSGALVAPIPLRNPNPDKPRKNSHKGTKTQTINVYYGNIPIIYENLIGSVKQKSKQWVAFSFVTAYSIRFTGIPYDDNKALASISVRR